MNSECSVGITYFIELTFRRKIPDKTSNYSVDLTQINSHVSRSFLNDPKDVA